MYLITTADYRVRISLPAADNHVFNYQQLTTMYLINNSRQNCIKLPTADNHVFNYQQKTIMSIITNSRQPCI